MTRLVCRSLLNFPPHRLRRFCLGLLVGEIVLAAAIFALIGLPNLALYVLAAALLIMFIGLWRERLLYST